MIIGINLRKSVQSALDRWDMPIKPEPPAPPEEPAPPPLPQEPTHVPLADGIQVGNQRINTLTLRVLDTFSDALLIGTMQSDFPGVLRLAAHLSGVPFADLSALTERDFNVVARAVKAHLQAHVDNLKKAILNFGR